MIYNLDKVARAFVRALDESDLDPETVNLIVLAPEVGTSVHGSGGMNATLDIRVDGPTVVVSPDA